MKPVDIVGAILPVPASRVYGVNIVLYRKVRQTQVKCKKIIRWKKVGCVLAWLLASGYKLRSMNACKRPFCVSSECWKQFFLVHTAAILCYIPEIRVIWWHFGVVYITWRVGDSKAAYCWRVLLTQRKCDRSRIIYFFAFSGSS